MKDTSKLAEEMIEIYDSENMKHCSTVSVKERRHNAMEAVVIAMINKKSIWLQLYEKVRGRGTRR